MTGTYIRTLAAWAIAAALLLGGAGNDLAAQSQGRITGVVRDAATQGPVSGAEVRLSDGTSLLTDAQGRYAILAAPIGTLELEVVRLGYRPIRVADVLVRADRTTVLSHTLEPVALELESVDVTVTTYFDRQITGSATAQGISNEEVRRTAGAIGDVLRLAQAFPGVALTNDTRNDLVVRGGSPAENLTIVDGIEVPTLNHFSSQNTSGGPVSMLNTDLIDEARFSAGGFEARFADRLSSVLDLEVREGSRDRTQFALDMGIAGFGAIGEGPLGNKGSWVASLRRSYLELLQDAIGLSATPEYWNLNAKFAYDVSPRDQVWGLFIGGIDDIQFDFDAEDLDDPFVTNTTYEGWRTIAGANWRHVFDWGYTTVTVSDAMSAYEIQDRDTRLDNALTFDQNDRDGVTTAKLDVRADLARRLDGRFGVDFRRHRGDFDVALPLGAENPFSADPVRVNPIDVEGDVTSADVGGHGELTLQLTSTLDLTAGARVDAYDLIDETRVSPRARLRLRPTETFDVGVSAGIYHQAPPLVFLSVIEENRQLDPIRSEHLVVSTAYYPQPDVRLSLEGYWKGYESYPVSTQFPELTLANTGTDYGVAQLLFPMTSDGTGESRGIEFSVQKKYTGDWYGQFSYSLADSEHAALDGVTRPAAFDIRHTFSVFGGTALGDWLVSGKFTYASGRPYTPFLVGPSQAQNRGIFDLAQTNAARSPDYQRLDLRVERQFTLNDWSLFVFSDVVNVTNRVNAQQRVWNGKTLEGDWLDQFALVPNIGFSVKF